jgi:hypothetical protein
MFCARHPGCWLFHDVLAFSPSAVFFTMCWRFHHALAFSPSAGFFTICLSGVVSG